MFRVLIAAVTVVSVMTAGAQAQTVTVLHDFGANTSGSDGGLVAHGGYLFGTSGGGTAGFGQVFRLDPVLKYFRTLYSFKGAAAGDAEGPASALVFQAGKFYGVSTYGGDTAKYSLGYGTVFAVDAVTGAETLVHQFTGMPDGATPEPSANLVYNAGVLYGTTYGGGASNDGTIFAIDVATGSETVLHSFAKPEGKHPEGGLLFRDGVLYGTTYEGGIANGMLPSGMGTLFQFDLTTGILTTLYKFAGGTDGGWPSSTLLFHGGNLFGTTLLGGTTADDGTIFKFDLSNGIETVLHRFTGGADGEGPTDPLTLEAGRLYGTSQGGPGATGAIFSVDPITRNFRVLYAFSQTDAAGYWPVASLLYRDGAFFGSTTRGDASTYAGSLFKLVP